MKLADVAKRAFAMPLTDPAYPRGPYKFYNREFVVISYRSDPDILREVVPEPLEVVDDTVNYEFIRMPDSTGFGDYTETGQVIPVRFRAADGTVEEGGYVHAMYLEFADRWRARDLGLSEEARQTKDHARERDLGLHLALWLGAVCVGHHGLQTSRA
jgi:acetoacetate decarboxylase